MTTKLIWNQLYATDTEALYADSTGDHDPEIALLVQCVDDSEVESSRTAPYHVYRFSIPRRNWTVDHAADDSEWYDSDLASIADSAGYSDPSALADRVDGAPDGVSAIRTDLASEDPRTRASAYMAIVGHWGADNFDAYPTEIAHYQAEAWPDWREAKLPIKLSTSDDDDGTVTVYCDDVYGAIDDQSIDGSLWGCPGDTDFAYAYASVSDAPDLLTHLEAAGYDVDSDEYSEPSAEDMERWGIKATLSDAEGGRYYVRESEGSWHVARDQTLIASLDTEIDAWRAALVHHKASGGAA